jgi:hypothetical protein
MAKPILVGYDVARQAIPHLALAEAAARLVVPEGLAAAP